MNILHRRTIRQFSFARRENILYLLLIIAAGAIVGCKKSGDVTLDPNAPIPVATSVAPHAWLIDRIGGELVTTTVVVPAGSSPATFQPDDAAITDLMRCAVYFRTGVPFERGRWFEAIEHTGKPKIVDLRTGLPLRAMERHIHHDEPEAAHDHGDHAGHDCPLDHSGGKDPHVWLSPANLILSSLVIAKNLSMLAPQHADTFMANQKKLHKELLALDKELAAQLKDIPNRTFFVFHPSWGYFADAYILKQVAIEMEGKEPTDAELTELQRAAREQGITRVFVQPQISSRAAEVVAESVGGTVVILDPLEPDVPASLRKAAKAIAGE